MRKRSRAILATGVIGIVLILAVRALTPDPDYGPLFVVKPFNYGLAVWGYSGVLSISESCAALELEDGFNSELGQALQPGRYLLAWPSNSIEWDGNDMSIEFQRSWGDADPVRLRNGEIISLGGGVSRSTKLYFEVVHDVDLDSCALAGGEILYVEEAIHGLPPK